MRTEIIRSLRVLGFLTLLTGCLYPLAMTGLAWLLFPDQSIGSSVIVDGKSVGSSLVGQAFTRPEYFWPRPSATDYSALPSGGSNLGPTSRTLTEQVEARRISLTDPDHSGRIPTELLYASGSGIDPHISPEAARYQINRVAKARKFDVLRVRDVEQLVARHTEGRTFGLLGEPRVNVLLLNLALDSLDTGQSP